MSLLPLDGPNEGKMLTPEERLRIEEEERKRIAEEQYRAEVRARLQPSEQAPVARPNRIPWILGIGAVLIAGTVLLTNNKSQSRTDNGGGASVASAASAPDAKTRYVPASEKIATGQIIVKAQGYVQYRIVITPEMVEPTVTGNFNASGGTGNDIAAVVADETNYTNWINGHQAQVFWGTSGKETTGNFQLHLKPGLYYLAFSNKFSAFTDKQVFLEADLNYKRAETYY